MARGLWRPCPPTHYCKDLSTGDPVLWEVYLFSKSVPKCPLLHLLVLALGALGGLAVVGLYWSCTLVRLSVFWINVTGSRWDVHSIRQVGLMEGLGDISSGLSEFILRRFGQGTWVV
jgi:hypothetical protein